MSSQFISGGGLFEPESFLKVLTKNEWRRMDIAVRQGAQFDKECDCRITKAGVRLEFRLENGKWRWAEAWFSGD